MDFFFAKREKQINTVHHKNVTKENLEAKFHDFDNKIQNCESKIHNYEEKIRQRFDTTDELSMRHGKLIEILVKNLDCFEKRQRISYEHTITITEQLKNLEDRINQLEAKNNPKPKLSIETIPPISFLSK